MPQITIYSRKLDRIADASSACLVIPVFEDSPIADDLAQLDKKLSGTVSRALDLGDFSAAVGTSTALGKQDCSGCVSKFFNDSYLKKVGVYEPNTKILYSTRHTFITRAKVIGVEDALLKKLVGHEQEFTHKHYAANMFDLAMLQQGINRVEYPSLDLKAWV